MVRRVSGGLWCKVPTGAVLALAVLGVGRFAAQAKAGSVTVADTGSDLSVSEAFVEGRLPAAGTDVVIFDDTLKGAVNSSYRWSLGAAGTDGFWGGVTVLNPGGDILLADEFNTLHLSGSGIELSGATRNLTLNLAVALEAAQTWNVAAGRLLTIGGTVTGGTTLTLGGGGTTAVTGSLQCGTMTLNKVGGGTLILSSQSTYTGATALGNASMSGGTLVVDFSGATAPASNIVGASSKLNVAFASVNFVGNSNTAVAQTFGGTVLVAGLTTMSATSPGMGVTVNLGQISRSGNNLGVSVRVIPNAQATTSSFQATNAAASGASSGLVETWNISYSSGGAGPYMTWGMDDFAGVSNGAIGTANYTAKAAGSSISSTANGTVYDLLNSVSGTVTCGAWFVEGVRFAGAGAKTFNLTGTSMVLGAVLVAPSVGTDTVTIGSTAGGSIRVENNSDLVIWQNNTRGSLILSAPLAPRQGGSYYGSLTKNGAGTLVLTTTSNSLNGGILVNEGMIQINAASALGSYGGAPIVLQGGGLRVDGTFANSNGTYQHPLRIAGDGGILEVTDGNIFTIASSSNTSIIGTSLLTKSGPGTLALANTANSWTGGLDIEAGVVDVRTTTGTPLGSGPVTVHGGTLGISGSLAAANVLTVKAGGIITATGTLTSAFTINDGGIYLVNTGTVNGNVTLATGAVVTGTGATIAPVVVPAYAILEPASRLTVGTLDFQSLTLQTGSILNLTLTDAGGADQLNILSGGTLNLGSGIVVNMFDAAMGVPYFHNGTHSLFTGIDTAGGGKYLGGISTGGILSNFIAGNFNAQSMNGATATFSIVGPATASSIIVTIAGIALSSNWNGAVDGVWSNGGNWSAGVPGAAAGDQACFTGDVTPGVIELGAVHQHLGMLALDAGTRNGCWTIAGTGGGKLLLDNGTNPAAIQVGNGAAHIISANIDVLSPTAIEFNSSASTLIVSGVIHTPDAGTTVTVEGPGQAALILTGDNTISALVHVAGGTLQIGNGGTSGSLGTGAVLNEASLFINRSDAIDVPNPITGTGTLTQLGAGTTTLTGAANYSGPTIVSAGKLVFGGTGVTHSIAGVSGAGTLQVASSATLTSDGVTANALLVGGVQTIRSSSAAAYAAYATGSGATVLSGTSKVSSLSITGSLDIKNNALIIQTADTTSKAALLAALANTTSGMLVTGAITSSSVTSNTNYRVSVIDNGILGAGAFGGWSATPTSVIVTETLKGDATMDGSVDLLDLANWKSNVGHSNVYSPVGGDMNGDGGVDLLDLALWKANVGHTLGNSPAPSDFASGGVGAMSVPALTGGEAIAVPEPTALVVMALGAIGLLLSRAGPSLRKDSRRNQSTTPRLAV